MAWTDKLNKPTKAKDPIAEALANAGITPGAPQKDVSKMPTGGIGKTESTPAYDGLRNLNAQVRYDSEGRPIRNDYTAMTDGKGNLLDQFKMGNKIGADINLDRTALNEIQSRALSTAPSAWAQLAEQKQRMQEGGAINQANRQALATQNQQYANLASRGGLSAGQRERLAMQTQRNQFAGGQQIRNQGAMGRLEIGLQDQQEKTGLLQQLPGMQMNAANFDQSQRAYRNQATAADLGNAMKDIQGYNAYNANAYDKAMEEWGANKQAEAQARASSGGGGGGLLGCYLTTATCEAMGMADDCWVLEEARRFRDTYMTGTPEKASEIVEYYQTAPVVVEQINKREDATKVWKRLFWKSIVPFVNQVKLGNLDKAYKLYKDMIVDAKSYT